MVTVNSTGTTDLKSLSAGSGQIPAFWKSVFDKAASTNTAALATSVSNWWNNLIPKNRPSNLPGPTGTSNNNMALSTDKQVPYFGNIDGATFVKYAAPGIKFGDLGKSDWVGSRVFPTARFRGMNFARAAVTGGRLPSYGRVYRKRAVPRRKYSKLKYKRRVY